MARRKKKKIAEKPYGVKKLDEYSVGDKVWGKLYDGRIAYGEIFWLFDKDIHGPSAKIYDQINDGYRSVLLESCSTTAPKRGKSKLRRAKVRNKEL